MLQVDGTIVKIFVQAKNLKQPGFLSSLRPQCRMSYRLTYIDYARLTTVGDTEPLPNSTVANWMKHFNINYVFEKDKELVFSVYNYNSDKDRDLIGECKILLNTIMATSGL